MQQPVTTVELGNDESVIEEDTTTIHLSAESDNGEIR